MTTRVVSRLLISVSLLALGCGDDGADPLDAGPLPTDQCTYAADMAIVDAYIATTPSAGLSDGCLVCYSPAASCAATNCAVECLGNTCYECMEANGCIEAPEDRTGLAIP